MSTQEVKGFQKIQPYIETAKVKAEAAWGHIVKATPESVKNTVVKICEWARDFFAPKLTAAKEWVQTLYGCPPNKSLVETKVVEPVVEPPKGWLSALRPW